MTQFQLLEDVVAHSICCGGGQRGDRDVGKMLPQIVQLSVFRAKIVAPFADAMSLVDRDVGNVPFRARSRKFSIISRSGAT